MSTDPSRVVVEDVLGYVGALSDPIVNHALGRFEHIVHIGHVFTNLLVAGAGVEKPDGRAKPVGRNLGPLRGTGWLNCRRQPLQRYRCLPFYVPFFTTLLLWQYGQLTETTSVLTKSAMFSPLALDSTFVISRQPRKKPQAGARRPEKSGSPVHTAKIKSRKPAKASGKGKTTMAQKDKPEHGTFELVAQVPRQVKTREL